MNFENKNFYFEKQKNSFYWAELHNKQNFAFFTQVSFENENGDPVVILQRDGDGMAIKLTEGMSYWSMNLTDISYENVKGYWAKLLESNITFGN